MFHYASLTYNLFTAVHFHPYPDNEYGTPQISSLHILTCKFFIIHLGRHLKGIGAVPHNRVVGLENNNMFVSTEKIKCVV